MLVGWDFCWALMELWIVKELAFDRLGWSVGRKLGNYWEMTELSIAGAIKDN